jgi:hypothetical protein
MKNEPYNRNIFTENNEEKINKSNKELVLGNSLRMEHEFKKAEYAELSDKEIFMKCEEMICVNGIAVLFFKEIQIIYAFLVVDDVGKD